MWDALIVWIWLVYGIAAVLSYSKIAAPLRRLPYLGKMFSCAMCSGFWIGIGLTWLELGPAPLLPVWLRALANGFMAAGLCLVIHAFVLNVLRAKEL